MKAVLLTRFGGTEVLDLREVPAPNPGAGHVVVDAAAGSIKNTDVWTRPGVYGSSEPAGWLGPIDFPRILGADVCGQSPRSDQVWMRPSWVEGCYPSRTGDGYRDVGTCAGAGR